MQYQYRWTAVLLLTLPICAQHGALWNRANEYFERGRSAFDAGRYDEAIADLQRALAINPMPPLT